MKSSQKNIKKILVLVVILVIANIIATQFFQRYDLTKNKRYTLSEPTKDIVNAIDDPLTIKVFLKGDFPSNFKRLQNETRYLLEEFEAYNSKLKFEFINPLEESQDNAEKIGTEFFNAGMPPRRLNVKKNGKDSQSLIFPWAIASYQDQNVKIPLLKSQPGDSNEDLVNKSVQNLEHAFADGLKRLTTKRNKKIAIMRGNGELPNINLGSFLKTIGAYYHVAPFTLDSIKRDPQKTLAQLEDFDLIVEAKPTKAFTEDEKYVLDQYLMNGGKALWLVDAVIADKDSLFNNPNHNMLAYPHDLKLTSFFFKYGVRIMPSLINDLHCDDIVLASGQGSQTQFKPYPWFYSPLVEAESNHPIVNNIDPVRFDFANPMDTLKNGIKKTVLLKSSIATKVEGTPMQISLDIINHKPDFNSYRNGPQNLAVLLEGEFTSVYKDRVKPLKLSGVKDQSTPTKMIVISDGDVIKNKVKQGKPASLEYDPYTGRSYGNKEFLLNAVNYMLDDSGLLNIRTKKVSIAFLDTNKIEKDRTFWEIINIGLPLLMLAIFGFAFSFYRKKKYKR